MKSYNLLSLSWRTKKASGLIQSKPEGLETRGTNVISLGLSPKAQELGVLMSQSRGCMSQLNRESEFTHP